MNSKKMNIFISVSITLLIFYYLLVLKYLLNIYSINTLHTMLLVFAYPIIIGLLSLIISTNQKNKIGIYLSLMHISLPFIFLLLGASIWTIAGFFGYF